MLQSFHREVKYPFHVIFDLNGVLLEMKFNSMPPIRHQINLVPLCTICLRPGLKDFLGRCLVWFEVYIWSVVQWHNINVYLNKIYKETQIKIDPSKILRWETCKQNDHFLSTKHEKLVFHKNLDVVFNKYLGIHLGKHLACRRYATLKYVKWIV